MSGRGVRVCVEGNIGCGKSTALARLEALRADVRVVREPVDEWEPLLAEFYREPCRWALAMQLQVLLSFDGVANEEASCIVERSPMASRHVFGQLLFNEGKMSQQEWEIYKQFYEVLGWTPDVIVYVDAPPEICMQRIEARGRPAERNVDVQYLKRLEFQYETMLRYAGVPVVRIDGTRSPHEVALAVSEVVDKALDLSRQKCAVTAATPQTTPVPVPS